MKNVSVLTIEPGREPPFFAWSRSRPNLAGAWVGSGTLDFRSRSHPKKWGLRNTVKNKIKLQLLAISLPFSVLYLNFPSWIRIRILNADPDPGGNMNADPDPQPWLPAVIQIRIYYYADPDPRPKKYGSGSLGVKTKEKKLHQKMFN